MQRGAQLSTTASRALRFTANVTKALYEEVTASTDKEIAFLTLPTLHYDKVNPNGYTYIDWIKKLVLNISMF